MREEPGAIQWRSGVAPRAARTDEPVALRLARLAQEPQRHVVVQFDRPVTVEQRAQLAAAGVSLQRYLGANAYFAALAPAGVDAVALAGVPSLLSAEPVRTEHKLHPAWADGAAPAHALVGLDPEGRELVAAYVVFHPDVALESEGVPVVELYGVVRDSVSVVNALVVEVPRARLADLAAEDGVQWIEPPLPRMSEWSWNDSNRARIGAGMEIAGPAIIEQADTTILVDAGWRARLGQGSNLMMTRD